MSACVEGKYGVTYDIPDDRPIESIDHHIRMVVKNFDTRHPDLDRLLEARLALTRRARADS